MFQHRIEDRQQCSHAGRERHLFRFAGCTQALIEDPDHRIEPCRHSGAHIEHRTHLRPSTPDGASPPQRAAVTIQWGDADEGRNLLVCQGAEFRETGQQGRGQDGTHTRHTLQQFVFFTPHRALMNGGRQGGVGRLQFPLKPGERGNTTVSATVLGFRHVGSPPAARASDVSAWR